jgi:hypothetical protein
VDTLWVLTREIGGELFAGALLWTVVGSALGVVLAVACHFLLQAVGGLRWDWPPARWLRWLSLAMLACCFVPLVGSAGFCEGVLRSTRWALTESPALTEHYPALGSVGADFVGALLFAVPRMTSDSAQDNDVGSDEILQAITDFRNDDWQIDPDQLIATFDDLTSSAVDAVVPDVRAAALEIFPNLGGGWSEKLLDLFLESFGKLLLGLAIDEEVLDAGTNVESWLAGAAGREGDPSRVSHRELSLLMVDSMVGLVERTVIRPAVRGQQVILLLPLPFLLLLPIMFFRGAHFLHQAWKRPSRTSQVRRTS